MNKDALSKRRHNDYTLEIPAAALMCADRTLQND
jgi:hypothetical protein